MMKIPSTATVEIAVYNMQGQLIVLLANGYYPQGNYSLVWNGNDLRGIPVEGGVYLYRMMSDRFTFTRRMMLVS